MRPIWTVLVCSLAWQLSAPSPAQAWWEYIEALSGPNLHGPHFDGRVFCFMEERSGVDKALLERYKPKDEGVAAREAGLRTRVIGGVALPCLKKIPDVDDYRRRFSIDAGLRYHWDSSFPPAGSHKVNFLAFAPLVTWYPIRRPTRDVIDLSAGVGVYWFVSNAFPSFSGRYYDLRLDLHVPTVVRRLSKWTFLIPTGRVGVLDFPSGFDKDAFADTRNGLTSKPMPGAERVRYIGFFFDLDALYQ